MNDTPHSQPPDAQPLANGRRRFCQGAIGGMSIISAGTVGYPIVTFLKLPKSMAMEESIEVPISELSEDVAFWGERSGQQIAIILVEGSPLAFNGTCPHLGCIVQWDGPTRTFKCPCHGAVFSDHGVPVSGPVNAPLKSVDFQVKDGNLKIT